MSTNFKTLLNEVPDEVMQSITDPDTGAIDTGKLMKAQTRRIKELKKSLSQAREEIKHLKGACRDWTTAQKSNLEIIMGLSRQNSESQENLLLMQERANEDHMILEDAQQLVETLSEENAQLKEREAHYLEVIEHLEGELSHFKTQRERLLENVSTLNLCCGIHGKVTKGLAEDNLRLVESGKQLVSRLACAAEVLRGMGMTESDIEDIFQGTKECVILPKKG